MIRQGHIPQRSDIAVDPDEGMLPRPERMIEIVWQRRWMIGICGGITLALSIAYLFVATKVYLSEARLHISKSEIRILDNQTLDRERDNYLYTQAEIIVSRPVLERVVGELNIEEMSSFPKKKDPVKFLKKEVGVEVGRKDDIVSVWFESEDKEEAALIVNSIVHHYMDYYTSLEVNAVAQVRESLENERIDLNAAIREKLAIVRIFEQRVELSRLEIRLKDLLQVYGSGHNQVKLYQRVIDETRQDILDSTATLGDSIDIAKINQLAGANRSAREAELTFLKKELDQLQQQRDVVTSRINELNAKNRAGALNVTLLEEATAAEKPSKPNKKIVLAGGLAGGLFLGSFAALGLAWLDRRLRSVEEIKATLSLPILGTIPAMGAQRTAGSRGQVVHLEPLSIIAEAYRILRTTVSHGVSSTHCKSLLLTSPDPGAGKSTSVSNLAIAFAQNHKRVLLIDGDMRKPVQQIIFDLPNAAGLSDVLGNQIDWTQVVQSTGIENLDVIPAGPIPVNPSELLNTTRFKDLLREAGEQYDMILLDSPPVIDVTDARVIASLCDASILVVRPDKSHRDMSADARDALLNVGANLMGIIVNDLMTGSRYRYSAYRQYGHTPAAYGGNGKTNGKSAGRLALITRTSKQN